MNTLVIDVLHRAGSQDPNVLKPAEQMLKEWETQRGFYTVLYNVFSNYSLEVNVRWMALLCFKNGVERYWRKNAPDGIAEDEKEFLRQCLTTSFNEPVNQLATHIAVVIGKIARLDCPREWDSLIPTLLNSLQKQNAVEQHRALLTLYHVIKALASKRLLADKKFFEQLTNNMFNLILDLWNTYTESFLSLILNETNQAEAQEALTMALLLLRILRKFITNGFSSISKYQDAMLFLKIIFTRAASFLECRKTLICRGVQTETLDKFILYLTKIQYGAVENHSTCYVELIPALLEFVVFYCFTEEGKLYSFEKFIIQCFNLMKAVLINPNYRTPIEPDLAATKDPIAFRANQLKQNFFTPVVLKDICSKLITHYFLLTSDDLEMWTTDPENYAVEDSRELWKYNLRTCTQTVFLAIFPQSCGVMTSVLIDLMHNYYQPVDPNDYHAILMKDAVYLAVGLAALDLYDEIDFNQWFLTSLKNELEIKNNNYRIIKRRVCWLIGKWTRIKLSQKLKPDLYKMMIRALSPEEDLVVRLEASNTLKQALDDFHIDEFLPFLETTFSLLFALLREVLECDTKMQVLYVLSFVIERVGSSIKPHVGPLSSYLPSLWEISEKHNMMRCAIISTLVHYVKALSSESIIAEPMIVRMVNLSCDLKQDAHVYLMEDGLELWLALLENAPASTPGIMSLIYNMPDLLDSGLDQVTFRPAIYIIQAYVLLSPQEILGELGSRIVSSLNSIISDLRSQEIISVMELFILILKISPESGARLIKFALRRFFKTIYMNEEYEVIMVTNMILVTISRLLFSSRDVFVELIKELSIEIGGQETEETVLDRIIEVWLLHMSDVTQSSEMKILALALCSLLSISSPPIIYHRFPAIISSIVEVLNDIMRPDNVECYSDSLLLTNETPEDYMQSDEEDSEYKTEHQIRLKRLNFEDPAHTICLRNFLENQLNTLRRSISSNQFDQMIAALRPEIDQQLKEYISL